MSQIYAFQPVAEEKVSELPTCLRQFARLRVSVGEPTEAGLIEVWANRTAFAGVFLNPVNVSRVGTMLVISGKEMFGPAGAQLVRIPGGVPAIAMLIAAFGRLGGSAHGSGGGTRPIGSLAQTLVQKMWSFCAQTSPNSSTDVDKAHLPRTLF